MSDPAIRERLRAETDEAATLFANTQGAVGGPPRKLIVQGVTRREDLQSYVGRSLGEIAEAEGKHYIDVMLDLSLETDLRTEFLGQGPEFNVDHMSAVYTDSPYTIPGVSDGGAHTKFFSGGAWTTDFLAWNRPGREARDRRGSALPDVGARSPCRRLQGPWRAHRRRPGRRDCV